MQSKDKEHESAIKSLDVAVSLDPDNVDIRYNLALAYEVAGKKDEAKLEYEKVLELDPNHKEASNNLGQGHDRRGQYFLTEHPARAPASRGLS